MRRLVTARAWPWDERHQSAHVLVRLHEFGLVSGRQMKSGQPGYGKDVVGVRLPLVHGFCPPAVTT
jgi:hypothetical protein